MLNLLPVDNSSKFKGDNFLFDYLSKASNPVFRYNMELTLKSINPINVFELPLGSQKVVDGDCSGLYCFKHKNTGKYGIGSALSCRSRLKDHLNSLHGHRPRTKLHNWILDNGGIISVNWSPIITYDNVVQEWYNTNYASPLSIGGSNILQGFGQYPARILEQCAYTNYSPCLNISNEQDKDIIFFNFSFKPSVMKLGLGNVCIYQAWGDKSMTILLAESNSYNTLANILNLFVATIRNNMNWHKGISYNTSDKGEIIIYLKGVPPDLAAKIFIFF